ncbi:PREDICTED: putative peptidyl-tRNA hydrolase PTRHD1 [Gekko japonicus]|uniref:peptidyl-tRNA hydrolase n=1 Tax=Gekko japonicus TaxID=146911 RepID=A0ABM1JSP6_GEKJA|nr:PREDICTED: putative peptidyl-tRNA hydrolase PTRHD1 [Gekko japonicus]
MARNGASRNKIYFYISVEWFDLFFRTARWLPSLFYPPHAQACHAALAVTHAYYDHPDTGTYLAQGGSMRTVVLEAPDESALTALAETLQQNGIDHKVWTEQPEDIPTCIALRPYPKEDVHRHLKKFKLLK